MRCKAAQVFEQRAVSYLHCVAALYDEIDAVFFQRFEDSEYFKSVAAYACEVCHQNGVYLVCLY